MINSSQLMLKNVLQTAQTAATLTEIAHWLHTSQPNISKIITDAEQQYQVKLVNRSHTPISLTSAGSFLLDRLTRLTNLENETAEELRNFNPHNEQTIKMAFFPTYAPILVPRLYPLFSSRHLLLKTQSLTTSRSLAALKSGETDILIGRNANNPDIASRPLFQEELCFVIAKNNPLYRPGKFQRRLTAHDLLILQQTNYISWQVETSFTNVANHFMKINDLHFSQKLSLATYEEAMLCAAQGLGTTLAMIKTASFYLATAAVNLLVIPPEMTSLEISLMYHANARPTIAKLATEIQQVLHS